MSVGTCFLRARLSQTCRCRVVGRRLVEAVVVGHPRPSLFGHQCTVGVLAGIYRCATESRVTLWQSTNPCCVCVGVVGVVTSCVPCARVRGRTSRSCATESSYRDEDMKRFKNEKLREKQNSRHAPRQKHETTPRALTPRTSTYEQTEHHHDTESHHSPHPEKQDLLMCRHSASVSFRAL